MLNIKTKALWQILCAVLVAISLVVVCAFCFSNNTKNQVTNTVSNDLLLATSITGATINFIDGANTAEYNKNRTALVAGINVSGSDIALDDTNFVVTYTRNGESTTDIKSVGEIEVTVTGQGEYEGSVTDTFTITPKTIGVYYNFLDRNENVIVDDSAVSSTGLHLSKGFDNGVDNVAITQLDDSEYTITYYNKNTNKFTDGVTTSGDYLVTVEAGANYNIIRNKQIEFYARTNTLTNSDGSIKVINEKGFEKGIKLNYAAVVTNPYTISARNDIDAKKFNVNTMININLTKDGTPYNPAEEVKIVVKTGSLNFEKVKLYTNNGATTAFEQIDYDAENDQITFKASKLEAFILAEGKSLDVMLIVAISASVVAILALIILNIVMFTRRKAK